MIFPVTKYKDLEGFAKNFAAGDIDLLMVISTPGTGKSWTFRESVPEARRISGRMTPIGLYMTAYEARETPIILDDIDSLYEDGHAVELLKSLCQTDSHKRVCWTTASKILREREIPNEYVSSSPICILGNEWHTRNRNVAAIVDRAITLDFQPSADEVHAEAGRWFQDVEIYDFIGSLLNEIGVPSLRLYVNALRLKKIGKDWRAAIASTCEVRPKMALMTTLLQSTEYATEAERVKAFEASGGSRPTYFRIKKEILRNRGTLRLKQEDVSSLTHNKAPSCLTHAT